MSQELTEDAQVRRVEILPGAPIADDDTTPRDTWVFRTDVLDLTLGGHAEGSIARRGDTLRLTFPGVGLVRETSAPNMQAVNDILHAAFPNLVELIRV